MIGSTEAYYKNHSSGKIFFNSMIEKVMKKSPKSDQKDLPPEYSLDYSKAKPNRFAKAFPGNRILVALDPDVAEVFKDSEAVNNALRGLIQAQSSGKNM